MCKTRVFAVAVGVLFAFVVAVSSVRADPIDNERLSGRVNALDNMSLHLPDVSRAEEHAALFAGLQSNNGKHLGFSVAAVRQGPNLGIVRGAAPTVTQNPEPATMLLLGTGLAVVGAAFRRRRLQQRKS